MRLAEVFRKNSYFTVSAMLAFAILGCVRGLAQTVKVNDEITVSTPAPWRVIPSSIRNMTRIEFPSKRDVRGAIGIRVIVTTEKRPNHENALQRLREIERERPGTIRFLEIDGWPAMERTALVPLRQQVLREKETPTSWAGPKQTTVVTVAVAAGDTLVRFEGVLAPLAKDANSEQVLRVAETLRSTAKANGGQTKRELSDLKKQDRKRKEPPRMRMEVSAPAKENSPAELLRPRGSQKEASLGMSGIAEVQVAVSHDGKFAVLDTNRGPAFSSNFGATYVPSSMNFPFGIDGDPSVGIGFSGNFYLSTLGFPTQPQKGCTASVAQSLDHGASFNFVGHAIFCSEQGPGSCSPDQEQMAVDQFHTPAGLDELYMAWRHFLPDDDTTQCDAGVPGYPFPMMSCSEDGGMNWPNQVVVGTGDPARITVGPDQFVYVTYIAGSNLMINKFSNCATGLKQQLGFPVTVASTNGVNCPVPGLDRCTSEIEASAQAAVDENNGNNVFVAYANDTGNGNEDVILRESQDGGLTWPVQKNMNSPGTARRFLPWVCSSMGTTFVTWYDRSVATKTAPDLTAYFLNSATQSGATLTTGTQRNVSGVSDPQCASGFPGSVDNADDVQGCPASTSRNVGFCATQSGDTLTAVVPLVPCDPTNSKCAANQSCITFGGCAKYGDYNGNACARGSAYVAWASATPPLGVMVPPPGPGCSSSGINVFTDHLNFPACGAAGQSCCFQGGTACSSGTLACDSTNTCVACGGPNQPCCGGATQCGTNLVCSQGQCQCGGPGQPCCGSGDSCRPGLSCGGDNTCSCGGEGQPCCNQTLEGGGSCNGGNLVCDKRKFLCITNCGHIGQTCCANNSCNFGGTCSNGTCECGGLNEACCSPGGTCNSNLLCASGFCTNSTSSCGQCQTNFDSCKQRCGNDAHCQCLCQSSFCGCKTAAGCGPCEIPSCTQP